MAEPVTGSDSWTLPDKHWDPMEKLLPENQGPKESRLGC